MIKWLESYLPNKKGFETLEDISSEAGPLTSSFFKTIWVRATSIPNIHIRFNTWI